MREWKGLVLAVAPFALLGSVGCTSNTGEDVQTIQSAIVGGTEAPPGKYPWQALISQWNSDGFWEAACGGSLIAPDWVLTAQHCVRKSSDGSLFAPSDLQVTLGETDRTASETPAAQVKTVAQVVPRDGFAAPNIEDLALIHLSSPVQLNQRVQLIRLAVDADGPGQDAYIAGWGSTVLGGDSHVMAPKLMELATRVVGPDEKVFASTGSDTTCEVIAENAIGSPIPSGRPLNDGDICTAINLNDDVHRSTCFGDSGSPLTVHRSPSCSEQIALIVTGNPFCSDFNIHMRVSTRLDWIRTYVPNIASKNVYEAETMGHSTGGETPGGWNIWTNGYASFTHNFGAGGPTQMVVTAAGQLANGVAPIMQITVNGAVVNTTSVAAATFTDYPFVFNAPAGNAEVRVNFTNDLYQPPLDRNLLLDKVKVVRNTCATVSPFTATLNVYNDWGTGYCARVQLTNPAGATPTTGWNVVVNTGSSNVTQWWNAPAIPGTGNHTITSVGWNAAIAPNTTYDQTGFCANRAPGTNTMPTVVSASASY